MSINKHTASVVNVCIALPGLHSWPTAQEVTTSTADTFEAARQQACNEARRCRNLDRAIGNEHGDDYLFDAYDDAHMFARLINQVKEYHLLEWRAAVYKEPMPMWARLFNAHGAQEIINELCEGADKLN